jgi:hypothetical protein
MTTEGTMKRKDVDYDWEGEGPQADGYADSERLLKVGERYYLENIGHEEGDYVPDTVNDLHEVDKVYAVAWLLHNDYPVPEDLGFCCKNGW